MSPADGIPLVDVTDLRQPASSTAHPVAAEQIDRACREVGFFGVVGHGIDPSLLDRLDAAARRFFALPEEVKAEIAMERAGAAWRGWFPVGAELTSGIPDHKEGLYFGIDHAADHHRVRAGTPLHGTNLYPAEPPELRTAVQAWLEAVRPVADAVMRGIALGLGLPGGWFERHLTGDPTILFRIFHYPPGAEGDDWGVGEHTDYGLLTLLAQDRHGGLEVRHPDGTWIDVPADPAVVVCNLGDMLERLTDGRYRSTPHRVRNTSGASRLSFPYFFDPSWDATVPTLPLPGAGGPGTTEIDGSRWDGADVRAWDGTYGEYLTAKVARVFPDLFGSTTR